MNLKAFSEGFYFITVTYYHDDYEYSFHELLHSDSTDETLYFEITTKKQFYVSLDLYPERVYPYECDCETSMHLALIQNGTILKQGPVTNADGFGFIWMHQNEVEPGTYQARISRIRFGPNAIHDFTLSVYSPEKVTIRSQSGH
jgi:hypothetical protein